MANDTFATFVQVSSLGTGDFLVGYRDINETRISQSDLISTLAIGITGATFNPYLNLNANSAKWESTYSTVNSSSASWNSAYTNLKTNSAFYGFISAVLFS